MFAQLGVLLSGLGPAGAILVSFVGIVGSLTGFYSVSILRCRLRGGRDCAIARRN